MSWAAELVIGGGGWRVNYLRFATRAEASGYADDLMRRWPAIRATRVLPSEDPVNLGWAEGRLLKPAAAAVVAPAPGRHRAIVLASGRSTRDICLPLLQLAEATTISVNNAVRFAPFAHYVFTLDTTDLQARLRLPGYRGQRIAAVPPGYAQRLPARRRAARGKRAIRYVDRVAYSGADLPGEIMTGCSGFGAMQLAYKFLGADEIFLFGCDHDDQGRYFYGDQHDARHQKNWSEALQYWNHYTPPEATRIWNVSPGSRIESLPKIDWRIAAAMLGLPATPVVTVLKRGREFDERHVQWLQRQIGYPIVCLTDSKIQMRDVISIPLKYNWPGWWSKMELFRDDLCLGNFLYMDLDTVLVDGICPIFNNLNETHVISDFYGQPWINSGLMFLHHSSRPAIWRAFSADPRGAMREAGPGGDQVFIDRFLHSAPRLEGVLPGQIVSYKAGVRHNRFHQPTGGNLETARIVCFHGQPRPWHVEAPWIPSL